MQMANLLDVSVRTLISWRKKRVGPPYYREVNRIYYYRTDYEVWRQSAKYG